MHDVVLTAIESGLSFARRRADVLAADVANARTPGFTPVDLTRVPDEYAGGLVEQRRPIDTRGFAGTLEFAMAAQADTASTHRALAEQERAVLREFRAVADESRR